MAAPSKLQKRHQRAEYIASRAKQTDEHQRCKAPMCTRLTRSAAGDGVGKHHCKMHEQRLMRHGSTIKDSYRAPDLHRYAKRTYEWLKANQSHPAAQEAKAKLDRTLREAGHYESQANVPYMTPAEKARLAWMRIRIKQLEPELVISKLMAVEAMLKVDPPLSSEAEQYRLWQLGKVTHRMAGGYHRREVMPGQKHWKFFQSSGHVLKHLGEQAAKVTQALTAL